MTLLALEDDQHVPELPTVRQHTSEQTIDRVLELARAQLGMDVAFVAEFEGGRPRR